MMSDLMIDTATLVGLAWKSVLIAGLTLALLRLARARSAGERSLIAHVGLLALLVLPAATLALPQWQPLPASWVAEAQPNAAVAAQAESAVIASTPATTVRAAVTDAAESPLLTWSLGVDLAPFLYLVPLALLFGVMLLAVLRLFAMRGRAEVLVDGSWLSALAEAQRRMGFKHGTALLVSDELRSPISWGLLRSTIVLSPKAVQAVGEAETIIAHELAHIVRLDWAKLLASRLACAMFWFNPLVWMLARESHQLREEAADDAVLMADIDGPDYATLLVGAARHDNDAALMAAHGVAPSKGSLKRRITRVLDASLRRGPASASWVLMSLVVLAGVTAPLAAFSATAADPSAAAAKAPMAALAAQKSIPASPSSASATQDEDIDVDVDVDDAAVAAATGEQLTAEELVSLRAVGVTAEYAAALRAAGGTMDAGELIAAKASGLDAAYVRQMRTILPGADMGEMVGAKSLGVDADFARDMLTHFPAAGLDDLIALKAMGIDCDFVTDMQRTNPRLRDADDAIEMRATAIARPMTVAKGYGRVARIEPSEPPEPPEPPTN